jgi:predicted metal-binding membrane protein
MEMPGNWTMSMAWMRMAGQTWVDAAASFLGMWSTMMVAMMMPSVVPTLLRYQQFLAGVPGGIKGAGPGWLSGVSGLAYFLVWTLSGVLVYPLGVALCSLAMGVPALARTIPSLVGLSLIVAGAVQCSAWKARQLARCRTTPGIACDRRATARDAWAFGWRLGLRCCRCCAPQTAVLLAIGLMDLTTMGLVTVAVSLERLSRRGARLAQGIGAVEMVAGSILLLRAW